MCYFYRESNSTDTNELNSPGLIRLVYPTNNKGKGKRGKSSAFASSDGSGLYGGWVFK
jgi:hypothetical protein